MLKLIGEGPLWFLAIPVCILLIVIDSILTLVDPTPESALCWQRWSTNESLNSGHDYFGQSAREHALDYRLGTSHNWTRVSALIGRRMTMLLLRI